MPSRTFRTSVPGEKSTPGFRASKDKLTLLLGANTAGDGKLKPVLVYHLEIFRPLTILLNLLCLASVDRYSNKAWMTVCLFTTWFIKHFNPTVKTYCSEKDSFQNITAC